MDIEACAHAAGIALVTYDQLGGRSAILSVFHGIPGVVVEQSEAPTRQRFSLAHEIGHWVLERAPLTHELAPIAARGRRYDELERVCDYFAACLLMPRPWVRDRVQRGDTVGDLARVFEVSAPAMSARLRELELVTQTGRQR